MSTVTNLNSRLNQGKKAVNENEKNLSKQIKKITNKYGDEVCMLKSKYPFLIIAVDVNRQRGIKKLIDKNYEIK